MLKALFIMLWHIFGISSALLLTLLMLLLWGWKAIAAFLLLMVILWPLQAKWGRV